MNRATSFGLLLACAACTGCADLGQDPLAACVKPTIAVTTFENRAAFPVRWDLGSGMKDVLVHELVSTGRYRVIERPEIDRVVGEINFQQSGATRQEQRAEVGRLKNVRYLVKGTVTDFGHVAAGNGFLGLDRLHVFHSANAAVMGITLYVIDVESGEVICSQSLTESVNASDTKVQAVYEGVSFGGSVFYRTPLGRATARVIRRAVDKITDGIASQPWEPKIALVRSDSVIVSGGKDRGVQVDTRLEVVQRGKPILDPDTGDMLGFQPGRRIGVVLIQDVQPLYSVARIIEGAADQFAVGQYCRAVSQVASR